MKRLKSFLLCVVLFASSLNGSAQIAQVPSSVIAALKEGNAGLLAANLNNNVELVIGNQNDVYSKQQASVILADFFRKNRVNGFDLLHKGNKDAASFGIGTLKTSAGNYRVYFLIRKNEIQQLRIETSND
jgi:hypothetical protein